MVVLMLRRSAAALVAAVLVSVSGSALRAQAAGAGHAHGASHGHAAAQEEEHEKSGWKELDAFHDVMSAAWHPARNDSLAPARANATQLVSAAKAWAKAKAPSGCQSAPVSAAIARLVPESEAVAALVTRKADDATLKAALKTVHDTFHVVEAGCKPAAPSRN